MRGCTPVAVANCVSPAQLASALVSYAPVSMPSGAIGCPDGKALGMVTRAAGPVGAGSIDPVAGFQARGLAQPDRPPAAHRKAATAATMASRVRVIRRSFPGR